MARRRVLPTVRHSGCGLSGMRNMMGPMALVLLTASLIACGNERPGERYLDRDGPPRRSDTLVRVVVDMADRIQEQPLTGDLDVDVTRELIGHHQGTIRLNRILIDQGEDAGLKEFAERLTVEREQEIAAMEDFLRTHPSLQGSGRRGVPDVMEGLHELEPTDDIDAAYREIMRMHLQDGLEMAQELERRGQHDEYHDRVKWMIGNARRALEELEQL